MNYIWASKSQAGRKRVHIQAFTPLGNPVRGVWRLGCLYEDHQRGEGQMTKLDMMLSKANDLAAEVDTLKAENETLRGALAALQEAVITRECSGVNIPMSIYTQVADALA